MLLDLRKIQHAVVFATELNFTRAARKLHLTQSALSRSIQTLEEDLGLRLFDRDQTGVVLTPVGAAYIGRAGQILKQAQLLDLALASFRAGEAGTVSFGIGPSPAAFFLPRLMPEIFKSRPGLRTNVEVKIGERLLDDLLAERIEFIVANTLPIKIDRQFLVRPLTQARSGLFVRSKHPLLYKRKLQLSSIADFPLITHTIPEGTETYFLEEAFGITTGVPVNFAMHCDNAELLRQVALNSDAIMFTSLPTVLDGVKKGFIKMLNISELPIRNVDMAIISLANRSLSPSAEFVIDRVLSLVPALEGSDITPPN